MGDALSGQSTMEEEHDEPRLSAAIMIPSLYLMARTDVPVTIGCLAAAWNLEIPRSGSTGHTACAA
jgi:hypothetical protein